MPAGPYVVGSIVASRLVLTNPVLDTDWTLAIAATSITIGAGLHEKEAMVAADSEAESQDARLSRLMRDAQSGDKRAYATLLRDCEPIIRRSAQRVGVNGDRIEDVVQETLLTLHSARQTYDPSRSFTAWLSVIAKRRGIDVLRRTGRSDRREVHAPLAYDYFPDPEADTGRGWEASSRAKDLQTAIAGLSPSQREAVEHLSLQGQSLAEAATVTGKTTVALKVNFHRALKALRTRLGGKQVAAGGEDDAHV